MNQIEIILNVICSTLLDPLVLERARRRKGAFSTAVRVCQGV